MSEVIAAPAAADAPAIVQELALQTVTNQVAEFNTIEAGLAELAKRYQGVAYDVSTTKGMDEAKQARMAIREVRYKAQNLLTATKKPLNDIKAQVDELAKRIIARIEAIEEPIDKQIKAEEQRKADEKAARERAEAEARAKVQALIDAIREFLVRASGGTYQEIAELSRELKELDISLELYGDRTGEALQLRNEVLEKLAELGAAEASRAARELAIAKQEEELAERRAAFEAEQEAARKAQAEREAAEQAERNRKARIQEHINDLHETFGRTPFGTKSHVIQVMLNDLLELGIPESVYGERTAEAQRVKDDLVQGLRTALGVAKEAEAKAAKDEQERQQREAELRAEAERLAKVSAAADDLLNACRVSVAYLADLNGADWIKGDDVGAMDMRQRAKAAQQIVFNALTKAGDYQ